MASPRVASVILNFKTPDDTLAAVASLKAMEYDNLTILVVDNASDDGLVLRLRQTHGDVGVIENHENLGFGGGCNVGIQAGLEGGAEYILLFNSDATATPSLLSALVEVAEMAPDIGVVGPTILQGDGPGVWYQGGTINRILGYTRHPGMGQPWSPRDGPRPTDYVAGCVMLVKRAVFEAVGLLEDSYFLYMDDAEFSERARGAGFRVIHYPGVYAHHEVSASMGARGTNVMTPLRAYYFARNMVHFIRTHIWGVRRWTALQGQIYARAPYRLLSMPAEGQWRSLRPYIEGLWDGFRGVTGKWNRHDRWVS